MFSAEEERMVVLYAGRVCSEAGGNYCSGHLTAGQGFPFLHGMSISSPGSNHIYRAVNDTSGNKESANLLMVSFGQQLPDTKISVASAWGKKPSGLIKVKNMHTLVLHVVIGSRNVSFVATALRKCTKRLQTSGDRYGNKKGPFNSPTVEAMELYPRETPSKHHQSKSVATTRHKVAVLAHPEFMLEVLKE
jgi:hypothetical protein